MRQDIEELENDGYPSFFQLFNERNQYIRIRTMDTCGFYHHFSYGILKKLHHEIGIVLDGITESNYNDLLVQEEKDREIEISEINTEREKQTKEEDTNKPGCIYMIKDVHNCYKIGRTSNIGQRFKKYITENSQEVKLIHTIYSNNTVKLEKHWQDYFVEKKHNREWFNLTDSDVEYFKSH